MKFVEEPPGIPLVYFVVNTEARYALSAVYGVYTSRELAQQAANESMARYGGNLLVTYRPVWDQLPAELTT